MTDKKRLIILAILYTSGIVLLTRTQPNNLPLIGLLIPFLYLFITMYLTLELLARRGFQISASLSKSLAAIASVFTVLLLVMRSITQLTLRDILLSLALSGILTWYITKLRKHS